MMLQSTKQLRWRGMTTTTKTLLLRNQSLINHHLQREKLIPSFSILSNSMNRSFSTQKDDQQPPITTTTTTTILKKQSFFDRWFGKEASVASPTFKSRWLMVIPAVMTHVCIGSPYGWSLVADLITKEYGFVASAATDWSLMQTSMALSIVFAFHGLSASLLGKWQLKVGPRKSMAYAALAFGGALGLGSLGVYLHSLPLIYGGYGALGGIGIGLGYTPPVQTLLQWFPDKKGIAGGIAIAGFGSGALVFTPAVQYLSKTFAKLPEYLGPSDHFITKTIEGRLFADVNGQLIEVVQAGATELSKIPYTLSEGLYVVGSGSTGAMESLGVIGAVYLTSMLLSSVLIKDPHPSYAPAVPAAVTKTDVKPIETVKLQDISVEDAVRSTQFPLLGLSFFCLATGGMGLFSVAKPMMSEVFSAALPAVVTSAFAAQFVSMLAAGNLGGRLGWAAVSDAIGRRKTFALFTFGSIPVYFSLPYLVDAVVTSGSSVPLYLFCAGTMAAISGMGGAFAILPAYEADLFGTKNIAAIHGRMLLASSSAGIAGPYLLLKLRSIAEYEAIQDLLVKVGPEKFQAAFNVPIEKASELIAAKTLTISKLVALAPPGTLDPTPHLYDNTMYALGSLMILGTLSHYLVKPLQRQPVVLDVQETQFSPSSTTSSSSDTVKK